MPSVSADVQSELIRASSRVDGVSVDDLQTLVKQNLTGESDTKRSALDALRRKESQTSQAGDDTLISNAITQIHSA